MEIAKSVQAGTRTINVSMTWSDLNHVSITYRMREKFRLTKDSPTPDTFVLQKYLVE